MNPYRIAKYVIFIAIYIFACWYMPVMKVAPQHADYWYVYVIIDHLYVCCFVVASFIICSVVDWLTKKEKKYKK